MFDWLLALVIDGGKNKHMTAWTTKDVQRLANANPNVAEQLRAQGVEIDDVSPKGDGSNVNITVMPQTTAPTNTALFFFGWTVTIIGAIIKWIGIQLACIGAGLMNGGRAMRDHAEHRVNTELS